MTKEPPSQNTQVQDTQIVDLDVHGVSYQIHLPDLETDYIQSTISETRTPYELSMLQDIKARVSPGDLVLDVGANVGNHTFYLACVAGCRVAAFEPNSALAQAIKTSRRLNQLEQQVEVFALGVGASSGRADFGHLDETNLGAQSLRLSTDRDAPIEVMALDEHSWSEPVRVIKVDVEGMELAVLEGAEQLITRDQPILYVECQTEADFVTINQWLADKEYHYWDTFNATPTHLFIPAKQVNSNQLKSHSLAQGARRNYQSVVQIGELRHSLDISAEKYRHTNEQLFSTKLQLQEANIKYQASNEQLASTKNTLQMAQEQLIQSAAREKSSSELITQLNQQKHELAQSLDATNQKYRLVFSEQIPELESSLQQALLSQKSDIAALETTHNALESTQQQLASSEHSLSKVKQELADAVAQKDALQQQFLDIKLKYEQIIDHEIPALSSELLSAQLDSETTEKLLATLRDEAATTQRELKSSEQRAAEREQALKQQLMQANDKYRLVTEQLDTTNRQLAESVDHRRGVEKQLVDLRDSVTFKTGSLLANQSGSLSDLAKLPIRMWQMKKLATQRAHQRQNEATTSPPKGDSPSPKVMTPKPLLKEGFITPRLLGSADTAKKLKQLLLPTEGCAGQKRVACILDDFSYRSYQPECELKQLTPDRWQQELEDFQPELALIESAWRGKDDLWGSKVGHQSQEVKGIVRWCNAHDVPTVFWNKEDPVHFESFINTARLFDFVFTTDIDCLHRYKAALNHERVYLLPFACQPALTNPIERYQRRDAFSFAGAYYVKYPHRTSDLEGLVENLPTYKPLEIYDRNYGEDNTDYQFPENYHPFIVGRLAFTEIDKAYKGYRYAINLNSIKQSQSMFARRVFELLGSNTLTISNFSRGIRLLFGELVLATDDGGQIVERLRTITETENGEDKLRLLGLRKVMQEHTYQDRLNYILSKVTGAPVTNQLPQFAVFTPVDSTDQLATVIEHVRRQNSISIKLYPLVEQDLTVEHAQRMLRDAHLAGYATLRKAIGNKSLADLAGDNAWCTGFLPNDYYGPNYLLDIALASRYSCANVVGKASFYHFNNGEITLAEDAMSFRPANRLPMRAAAVAPMIAKKQLASAWIKQLAQGQYEESAQLAIDRFNYCKDGAQNALQNPPGLVTQKVDDIDLNTGISAAKLLTIAERIGPEEQQSHTEKRYSAEYLADLVGLSGSDNVKFSLSSDGLEMHSTLTDGAHEYFYAPSEIDRESLFKDVEANDVLPLFLEISPGLNVSLVVLYLDSNMQRINHKILRANVNHSIEIPPATAFVRLGFRVYASGHTTVKEMLFGHKDLQPACLLAQSSTLLLTNHYPSYDDLYRNGFVHSRVTAYREHAVGVDIFRLRKNEPVAWHEFHNIDVTTGSGKALQLLLASGAYKHVLVHFLSEDMWEILEEFIDQIKVTVWLHGAEVQPWWRREYNYDSEDKLAAAKVESDKRLSFWKKLLNPVPENLKLVFVSQYFAEEVMEDVGVQLQSSQYEIIHNPIDTDLFSYQKKSIEQRKKILSIRPYASRKYANDLSVEAILALSEEPWFDELDIHMIGDGALFDELLEPLRRFSNVTIEKRFLTQTEIAEHHKAYGIFLCPTRMDAQGVSRDEAMASGLVPVTNAVAAIPEFVDDASGVLAPAENSQTMADGIKRLYEDPELFLEMSANAADRVREQTAKRITVRRELDLFRE